MDANTLIATKKELLKLQKRLGREMAKGKYKDTMAIKSLKKDIRLKKLQIGDITRNMILQLSVD